MQLSACRSLFISIFPILLDCDRTRRAGRREQRTFPRLELQRQRMADVCRNPVRLQSTPLLQGVKSQASPDWPETETRLEGRCVSFHNVQKTQSSASDRPKRQFRASACLMRRLDSPRKGSVDTDFAAVLSSTSGRLKHTAPPFFAMRVRYVLDRPKDAVDGRRPFLRGGG